MLTGEADGETAALGYFITPCVGTLITLISYMLLPKLVSVYLFISGNGQQKLVKSDRASLSRVGVFVSLQ